MIVPPHQRDTQLLTVFNPVHNINHEAIKVDHWEPIRPGSHLCRPVGLELRLIDTIKTPPQIWGDLNKRIMDDPLKNCALPDWIVHGHTWDDLHQLDDPDVFQRVMNQAEDYLRWALDDVTFRSDAAFCQNLHVIDDATKLNYLGGGVKTFTVKVPWKA